MSDTENDDNNEEPKRPDVGELFRRVQESKDPPPPGPDSS